MNLVLKIDGIKEVSSGLRKLASQMPYAVSKGINDTIFSGRAVLQKEIADSFDRPTPIVMSSVLYSKAEKTKLSGSIYIKSDDSKGIDVARILSPHVYGGDRVRKASERRLRFAGLMDTDQWITPGPAAPLDAYGNISAQSMIKILSQIQAFFEAGYEANATKSSRKRKANWAQTMYCIPRVGVFVRTGKSHSIPVLFFTKRAPQYKAGRFDFYYAINNHVKKNFPKLLLDAVTYALQVAW